MKPGVALLLAASLLSAVAGFGLYRWLAADPPGEAAAPELGAVPLSDLERRESRLEDWRRDLLVVNFWAPWCAPCRREIPALLAIRDGYRQRGVGVIGIAFDNAEQVRRFAEDYAIDYPLFLADHRAGMYHAAFGNASGALPFTAILDRDLRVLHTHTGELDYASLGEALDRFLPAVN